MSVKDDSALPVESTEEINDPKKSIWEIIIGVFTSPTEAFVSYVKRPVLAIPLIITIVLVMALAIASIPNQASLQYDMMKKSTILTPQQMAEMKKAADNPDFSTKNLLIAGGASIIFGMGFSALFALIAWGIGSFVFGGLSTFKKVWGVSLLTGLITMLGALARIGFVHLSGNQYFSLSLAALFPDKDFTSIMYDMLFRIDIFLIWALIVAGIGYAAAFNFSRGKGMGTSVVINILGIILATLPVFAATLAGVEITFF